MAEHEGRTDLTRSPHARVGADAAPAARPVGFPVQPPTVSPSSARRFAERVELRRRLTRRRLGIAAAVALVLAALGWLLLWSPVLALDPAEVTVRGEGTVVEPTDVREVVAERAGTPLPRLDTVGLRRELLDVAGVRAAEVERVWPRGLRITLVSREPVAAVPRDGSFALLDLEGVQVGRSDEPVDGLPVVQVPAEDPGARALTAVLTVLQQIPPELADEVVEVSARSQDTVRFVLADGVRVDWGSADENALKAEVLKTLRTAASTGEVEVVDVSAPRLPITRS